MQEAIRLAGLAAGEDEVPVGAVILRDGTQLGQGYNQNIGNSDPTAHAEIIALREACAYHQNYRLANSIIYVTLEPCLMCFTALIHARVKTLVYGASDPKSGFTLFLDEHHMDLLNHRMEVIGGIMAEQCGSQIQTFFSEKRQRGKRKWKRGN